MSTAWIVRAWEPESGGGGGGGGFGHCHCHSRHDGAMSSARCSRDAFCQTRHLTRGLGGTSVRGGGCDTQPSLPLAAWTLTSVK